MQGRTSLGHVDVVKFLEGLGVKNIRVSGDEVMFSCPSEDHRNGDANPSAAMNVKTTAWNCFGCGRRGNAITFLSDVEGVSTIVAMRWIREAFGGDGGGYVRGSLARDFRDRWADAEPEAEPADETLPESWLEKFQVDWGVAALWNGDELPEGITYPFKRGFYWQTLDHFQCGWEESEGRFLFPIHSLHSYLVGFKGRATRQGQEPRYRVLGQPFYPFPTCNVAEHVFNAHRIKRGSHVIVCEGELNAMRLWQLGHRNVVALNNAHMSDRQAEIVRAIAGSVTLYFDSDAAGNKGLKRAATLLHQNLPVSLVPPHHHDPADSTPEEVQDLLDRSSSVTRSYLGFNDYLDVIIDKD